MPRTESITAVGFNPPDDKRLALEVMSIEELKRRAPADHFATLQRADFFRLIGVRGGRTSPMVDFSHYAARSQDWLLIRPGQVMRYDFSRRWSGWILVFRPDSLFGSARGASTVELNSLRHVEDLNCLITLDARQHRWMRCSLQQMQHDITLTVDAALRNEMLRLQLAGTLLRLALWQTPGSSSVEVGGGALKNFKRFRQKLEADFAKHHQVQHYASELGMNEKALSRACQAALGMSAKACIAQRLALEAKRLLAHTTMAVRSVAHDLGFDEATNFVKFFRKEAGVTPLAFRRSQTNPGA